MMACMSVSAAALDAAVSTEAAAMPRQLPNSIMTATTAPSGDALYAEESDYYVYVADNSYDAYFVKNTQAQIDFIIGGLKDNNLFYVMLTDEEFTNAYAYDEIPLNDLLTESYTESLLSFTIDLDSTTPVGNYCLVFGISSPNGEAVYGPYYIDFHIVKKAVSLLSLLSMMQKVGS